MNPLFPCDHGAATHSCIMHDTRRGTLCKKAPGIAITTLTVHTLLAEPDPWGGPYG